MILPTVVGIAIFYRKIQTNGKKIHTGVVINYVISFFDIDRFTYIIKTSNNPNSMMISSSLDIKPKWDYKCIYKHKKKRKKERNNVQYVSSCNWPDPR